MQEKKDQLRKMVVHSRWDTLKEVKSKKGKEATTTILSPAFWRDVKLSLAVFEPLFKVLRLVDGDVKPSMGFIYGELLKAKREIKEALGNSEPRFKDVIAVIEKKTSGRLDCPLHLTAYLLNPHYSYSNPSIFDEPKITEGFIACVEKFYYYDEDMQDQAANIELKSFRKEKDHLTRSLQRLFKTLITTQVEVLVTTWLFHVYNFVSNIVTWLFPIFHVALFLKLIEGLYSISASWWRLYGTETLASQKMATRILSLTSSSSSCERNWSGFEGVSTYLLRTY
jgi:hypothetical protein